MAKWSGRGIPPTRKKLHRWRESLRRDEIAADKEMDAMYASIERESQRLGVDYMLTGD
jgi:hypothetical protein